MWAKPAQESSEPDVLPEHRDEMTGPMLPAAAIHLGTLWPGNLAEEQMERTDSVGDSHSFGFCMLI